MDRLTVGDGLLGVERAVLAGETLADNLRRGEREKKTEYAQMEALVRE